MKPIKIQIFKKTGKPNIIRCTRCDGSVTWAPIHPGLEFHDLAHYAVEFVLHFKDGFYGLINQGNDIGDFELPRDKRPISILPENLPRETILAEHLVNLLQVDGASSELEDNFIEVLKDILLKQGLPYPEELTKAKVDEIRKVFEESSTKWRMIPEDGEMTLEMIF